MHNFMCAASRAIAAGCFSSEEHLYRNQARDPSTVCSIPLRTEGTLKIKINK